jgi:hypothetical protein
MLSTGPTSAFRRVARTAMIGALLMPGFAATMPVAAQAAADLPATAAAAPADTALFMSFDLDRDSPQHRQAQALLARLGMAGDWDDWSAMAVKGMPSRGAPTQQDLDALLGGEAGIAILPAMIERATTAMESSGIESATPIADLDDRQIADAFEDAFDDGLGMVAILDPGDPDGAWSYVERQMTRAAADADAVVTQETYNGVTILSAPDRNLYGMGKKHWDDGADDNDSFGTASDDRDDPKHDGKGTGEIVTARVGDLIVTGTSRTDLEPAIDAAQGGDALSASDAFAAARGEFSNDAIAFLYANGNAITGAVSEQWLDFLAEQYEGTLTDEEVRDAFNAVSATVVWADDPGFRIDNVHLLPDGAPLPTVFDAPPSIDFASKVPARTFVYSAGTLPRLSLDQWAYSLALSVLAENDAYVEPTSWQGIRELYSRAELDRRVAEAERYIGFNLKTDFFDKLDGSFGTAFGFPGFGFAGFSVDAIATMGTSDPDGIATQLVRIARLAERSGEVDVSASSIDGNAFYAISAADGSQDIPEMGFGMLGDELVAGSATGIANYRNGPAQPLSGDPQFQQVMDLLPAEPWMEFYVDFGQVVPFLVQLSELGGMDQATTDADPACANYATQEEAQAAFEEEPLANTMLDSNFDGVACEDYFMTGAATPVAAAGSIENLRAFGMTAWERDGKTGWSMLLHVGGQ